MRRKQRRESRCRLAEEHVAGQRRVRVLDRRALDEPPDLLQRTGDAVRVPRELHGGRIGEQFAETRLDNLASQLGDQLCQLSGGPCVYKGPDMKTAHSTMDVTRAHFNALVEVLQQSMDARGIPFTRQNQMLALLAPMHRDVVNTR